MAGVTYPLIIGISLFTAVFALPTAPLWVVRFSIAHPV